MRALKLWLWGFLLLLTLFWIIAQDAPEVFDLVAVREMMVLATGILCTGVMSFAMVLAVRPMWLEVPLDGLDKSYRLHKWLGIAALVLAVAHWLWVNGVKIIVGEDMLAVPDSEIQSGLSSLPTLQQWFQAQSESAGKIGHVVFYLVVTLIALALIKRFPYRWFAKTHTVLAAAYLVYVYHSVVLMDFSYWHQPIGIVSGALMVAGTIAAVLILTRRVGHNRKVKGVIEAIDLFPELGVMETSICLQKGWKGHQGGQFAFVTFDPGEGAHPFTIGSAWKPETPYINFITKGLGDYTGLMMENLKIGDEVVVEGPYGQFTFADENKRQIWVGAGIGVTPFIARMKQLASEPQDQVIDLFVVGPVEDPKVKRKLTADAKAANVRLHTVIDGRDDRLTGKSLRAKIPDWQGASVWFCGPVKFGESLKKDMLANGLSPGDFHHELFNMR